MKHEIETWIEDAALSGGLLAERIPDEVAAEIEVRAKSKFVIDNPRAWWAAKAPVRTGAKDRLSMRTHSYADLHGYRLVKECLTNRRLKSPCLFTTT